MNVVANALVVLKYAPDLNIPIPQRAEALFKIMADELQRVWPDEQDRKDVVASIVSGGPYESVEQEAVSAGYYYDLKCRIEKMGHPVRDYVGLTPVLSACWRQRNDSQIERCFIHEMSDGLASPKSKSSAGSPP